MFQSFGVKFKLISAFSVSALIIAMVSFFSLKRLQETVYFFEHVVEVNFPNYVALSQIVDSGRRLNILIARVSGSTFDQASLKALSDELNNTILAIEKAKKSYLAIPFAGGEEELWNVVDERLKICIEYTKKAIEMSKATKPDELKKRDAFASNYEKVRLSYREAMDKLLTFQSRETEFWSKAATKGAEKGEKLLVGMAIAGVFVSLLMGLAVSFNLAKTMTSISHQLSHGADEVASASTQISSTAEQLSSSSVEQASAIQETASSVEEMSSMVSKNAENAKKSALTARDGMEAAETGKQVISEMLKAMSEIDAATKEIAEVVKLIGQIEDKTKVIDDIVFKTQLLSFNASVEAARAGEHGKGFAVVAEEVGNLAQMSGNAAREISEMLSQSLDRVDRMITSSKQKVDVGLTVGKRCGDVLEELVTKVSEINDMANEIAAASDEQARGVTEINKAMTQMDQMTQQNASAAQQSASSSGQLAQQAEAMRASVAILLQLLNGQKSASQRPQGIQVSPVVGIESSSRKKNLSPLKLVNRVSSKNSQNVPNRDDPGFDEAA